MVDSEIKFNSRYGFAKSAAKSGQIVPVMFRINCRDHIPEEDRLKKIYDVLDNYAYPEVLKRIEQGKLSPEFRLNAVQLVMYTDESRNHLLLNNEVSFYTHIKFKINETPKPEEYKL
jgi:hypothetical protein